MFNPGGRASTPRSSKVNPPGRSPGMFAGMIEGVETDEGGGTGDDGTEGVEGGDVTTIFGLGTDRGRVVSDRKGILCVVVLVGDKTAA